VGLDTEGRPVMYLIMILSVISLGVIIERIYNLNRARIDSQKFMDDKSIPLNAIR